MSFLLGALGIWAQPLLAGPEITGGNIQRLVTLGLVPALLAMATLLRETDPTGARVERAAAAIAVLLALGSMHHHYVGTWLPFFETNRVSIGLFLLGTISTVVVIGAALRQSRDPTEQGLA
jgi:hypothetical protein